LVESSGCGAGSADVSETEIEPLFPLLVGLDASSSGALKA
jgi:hypothetical protein